MKRRRRWIAAVAIGLVLVLLSVGAGSFRRGQAVRRTIEVDGRERTYYVYVPKSTRRPMPLVMVLHGGGNFAGNKARQMERYTRFNTIADREGFLVCYPLGFKGNWNDGRKDVFTAAHQENIDDVKFLRRVVSAIAKEYPLDRSRVFITGISNGAIMSHRMAAEASDLVTAIAPVVGGMADAVADSFHPKYPVSLCVIQGTKDPLVPFDGGTIGYRFGRKRGRIISTSETVEKYLRLNRITGQPTVKELPDTDPSDGTTTKVRTYPPGRTGARVQVYVVENGGHAWPGRPAYLGERWIGKVSQDFDGVEAVWRFFQSCPPRKIRR